MKRTGMSRFSPGCRVWAVKQKHSVLVKWAEARAGATEGTALPTIGRSPSLRAKYSASLSSPGTTSMVSCSGSNAHGSFELTPPSNCTLTVRDCRSAAPAAAAAPAAGQPAAAETGTSAPGAPNAELDFLSAAAWDHPQFQQGVRLFNQALDRLRLFSRDRAQRSLLAQIEEGAIRASQAFEPLRTEAPPAVPLAEYLARCRQLAEEARRLSRPLPAAAAASPQAAPRADIPPHRAGEPWKHPDYLEGARLFNQALAQYKLFLANKARTELLKPIEEDAFQAAKKFEALKGQAPEDVPIGDHITQCYKLISDCRRQHLEGANAEPAGPFDRSTAGPNRRPALPAYRPPP